MNYKIKKIFFVILFSLCMIIASFQFHNIMAKDNKIINRYNLISKMYKSAINSNYKKLSYYLKLYEKYYLYDETIYYFKTLVSINNGELKKAYNIIDIAGASYGYSSKYETALAYINILKNNYDQAFFHYKKALKKNIYDPFYEYNFAAICFVLNNYGDAIYWCKKAILNKPNFAEAYLLMAKICLSTGEYEEAEKFYNKALYYGYNMWDIYYEKALCLIKKGDYKSSMKYIKKSLKKESNPENLLLYGYLFYKKNEYKTASKIYKYILKKYETQLNSQNKIDFVSIVINYTDYINTRNQKYLKQLENYFVPDENILIIIKKYIDKKGVTDVNKNLIFFLN